jgi:hypothetical protein
MKTKSLILLASLAVLAISARAAQNQPEADAVVLPVYEVSAPRYLPAELQVNASLNELRQSVHAPACIAPVLPMFADQAVPPAAVRQAAHDAKTVRVAKL